ncbi:hypothetical protein LCGC14_0386150 [marine sediment metagenome]|uniref:Uncharacterized protein n=1 Tax=marine sediment metagenome TaxID=412755 RepID=A0A0F9VN21_9ZZZZ
MAKTFATIVDDIQSKLQDDGTLFTDAKVAEEIERVFREISQPSHIDPYIRRESFKLETRTGEATSDTANALVDATNAQFLSTDVDKVIYNTDDRTWAIVTAYVSASQLTLDRDAFPDGNENYEMFNKGCINNLQINIEDVTDYIGADHGVLQDAEHSPEFPLGTKRNVKVAGDILTVGIDFAPDDSADSDADIEVFVWFMVRHRVSQLTDLAGATTSAISAAATSVPVDGFSGTEIVAEGTEFKIAGVRGQYRVTAAVTLSSGAGTLVVSPPLEAAAAENDVVTVIGSTLTPKLEQIVVDLTAGRTGRSKAGNFINTVNVGGIGLFDRYRSLGNEIPAIMAALTKGVKPRSKRNWSKD